MLVDVVHVLHVVVTMVVHHARQAFIGLRHDQHISVTVIVTTISRRAL